MSLILDALKKAERQHKLGEVPGIGAQPASPAPAGMRGLGWLLLVLLACVMLGLGLYLGGFRLSPPAAQAPVLASPPMVPATEGSLPPVAQPPALPQSSAEVASPPEVETSSEVPVQALPPPPPPPPKPARPLIAMPSGFVASLPSLNIDIHSFDERPAKRYVLINMQKYREGDYLAEGPQLIEVLIDGVVLEHLGERFILPIGNQ